MHLGPVRKPLPAHADNSAATLQRHRPGARAVERRTTAAAALWLEARSSGRM